MKLLNNISIRLKVLLPIFLITAMLIVSLAVSIINLNRVTAAGREISDNYAQSMKTLGDISADFESLNRIIFAHCLAKDVATRNALKDEYDQLSVQLNQTMTEFETKMVPGEEADAYQPFKESYAKYTELFQSAIKYNENGESARAASLANGDMTTVGKEISEQIAAMIAINQGNMDAAIAEQTNIYNASIRIAAIIFAIAIILTILAFVVCIAGITRPLGNMNKKLRVIIGNIQNNNGDLTARVPEYGKDEIGQLAAGINTFIATLQSIMDKITNHSNKLEEIVGTVLNNVATANNNSCDISSVMEQLSASMQEVSSTVASVNENTVDVDTNVVELADASEGLLSYANEMQRRASVLENTAVLNKQNTSTIINDIIEKLKKAIEDSKSVDRVNDLTNEILSISSQTNLLALNASIEAARAGEAGKGFAVVADEIRQLADSSREAANNIQTINNMVVEAVNELIDSSGSIVKYINENVLPDYDGFVESGKQYSEDAVHVNNIVGQFNNMSSELKELTKNITEAINGISSAVEESANGITTAAVNTNDLVKDITQISAEMESNSMIAGELKKEANRFTNL